MTVTRTTIWTRTSNRAAREAPAVVRCGRVRQILLFGGGLSHGIPCRVVEETSRRITTGAATIAIAAGSTAFGGPQCCAPSAGGTGSRKASSMQLMAFSRRCLPHLPGSPHELALARMYHEILTKVGCIEADAPVPSVLE